MPKRKPKTNMPKPEPIEEIPKIITEQLDIFANTPKKPMSKKSRKKYKAAMKATMKATMKAAMKGPMKEAMKKAIKESLKESLAAKNTQYKTDKNQLNTRKGHRKSHTQSHTQLHTQTHPHIKTKQKASIKQYEMNNLLLPITHTKPNMQKPNMQKPELINPSNVNMKCSDIKRAKQCKTNAKCAFDYTEGKCKNNFEYAQMAKTI
jgi:hypothetical protein